MRTEEVAEPIGFDVRLKSLPQAGCWSTLLAGVLAVLAFGVVTPARAQYCEPASFVGDINEDSKVDADDVVAWNALFSATPQQYRACADLNRNGVLDTRDRTMLLTAVQVARPVGQGGLGSAGRIPAFTISEFRSGVPNPIDPQQRYIEFRLPRSFPQGFAFDNKFNNGVYLLQVSRGNGTSLQQGFIKKVIDLRATNATFATSGVGTGLALVRDDSCSLEPPGGVTAVTLPQGQSLTFANQHDFNTTWMLVYRRPSGGTYVAKAAIPTVGQRIDANSDCEIDAPYTNSATPPPNLFPPWDFVVDMISVDRSLNETGPTGQGCIYGDGPLYEVEPVDVGGQEQASFHVYRNNDNKACRGFDQVVITGIDTPGAPNPPSAANQFCGSDAVGPCSEPHGPFCSDQNCCEFVCAVLPVCCAVAWDANCVLLASDQCGTCGGLGTGSCLRGGTGPACNDETCCKVVCQLRPACCNTLWDQACADLAVANCLSCGASVIPNSCFIASPLPYCSDPQCCQTVCVVDPQCCTVRWDQACIDNAGLFCPDLACGSPAAGDCCLSHGTPYCNDAQCCTTVCKLDPYCCNIIWDVQCVSETLQFCSGVSCACGGGGEEQGCFVVHGTPGCNSTTCCNSVCNSDPFCCGVNWDASCVAAASSFCASNPSCEAATGSCLVAHKEPGCEDPACCSKVCQVEPNCCDLGWDEKCVQLVATECGGCGDVFAEDCLTPHVTPYCDNAPCCELVCATDSFCCTQEWDINCVETAEVLCKTEKTQCGSDDGRTCFVASFLQGCSDSACCEQVCSFDPFCCVQVWDSICVQQALTYATLGFGCQLPTGAGSGRGDCLQAHPQRSCSDVECAAAVCSIEPNCCRIVWDQACADLAPFVCITVGGCPGTGSSFAVHATPGSIDPSCCNAVCFERPSCCSNAWDQACVTLAFQRCRPNAAWTADCIGSCTEVHDNPGCEDVACASAVCFNDAQCCTIGWDQECVSLARGLCCGLPGCGNPCSGDCLLPHDAPYCRDAFCCSTVCAVDPFCCSTGWDGFCVQTAEQRCSSGCGSPLNGPCFLGHLGQGCSNAPCCIEVCRKDPYCCDTEWDDVCAEMAQKDTENCASDIECGDEAAGDCCLVHYDAPKCRDAACCEAVCELDTENFCRDFFWDEFCVELALGSESCNCAKECGDVCSGPCCEPHERTACNDLACCSLVCGADAFCCEVVWDVTCVTAALESCARGPDAACPPPECGDAGTGPCCFPHAGPSCANIDCCEAVCAADPFCCDSSWDSNCVKIAQGIGSCGCDGPSCGSPETGSCFEAQSTPFCAQENCCFLICGKVQPECCSLAWDESCVQLAIIFCSGGGLADDGSQPVQPAKPSVRLPRR